MLSTTAGATATQRTRRSFLVLIVVLGFLQAWASRTDLVSDTVSYLDIGDSMWHGHWAVAVNGLWNPLYCMILGVAVGVLRPSYYWEYPLVHLIVFLIYLFTLWAFDFLLHEMIALRLQKEPNQGFLIPEWVWLVIGYTLFLWASLRLIGVSETNPDMLVAAFFFVACGLLTRIRRGAAGWLHYVGLGAALGLGYLTKSIMFPVSLICLAVAFVIGGWRVRQVIASAIVFLIISGPFIVALSIAKGRVTFGESGRYNYAVHVNHLPRSHWQGEQGDVPGGGRPVHGDRQIFLRPATFEFGTPLGGTYPAWTDPSYWYDGLQSRFDVLQVLKIEARLLQVESLFFFEMHGSLIAGLFVLFYMSGREWSVLKDISRYWFLMLPAGAALGMYALIHLEPRYLAPFIVVFMLCLFFSAQLPASRESCRLYGAVAVFVFLMFVLPVESSSTHVRSFASDVLGQSQEDPNAPRNIVKEMYRMGLKPGDHIASLEYSLDGMSTWARLARVRIVAEVYYWPDLPGARANDFWRADSATQKRVIEALAQTDASMIVSGQAPAAPVVPGWQQVGHTQFYAYQLHPPERGWARQ